MLSGVSDTGMLPGVSHAGMLSGIHVSHTGILLGVFHSGMLPGVSHTGMLSGASQTKVFTGICLYFNLALATWKKMDVTVRKRLSDLTSVQNRNVYIVTMYFSKMIPCYHQAQQNKIIYRLVS